MSEFNIGDIVKVEKADVWRGKCVGRYGIIANNLKSLKWLYSC